MHLDYDPEQSKSFIATAVARKLLTDEQADSLSQDAKQRSTSPSHLAVESGLLKPFDVEVVEAFAAPKDLAPGYELLDVLGYGALGVVYRARQEQLKRDVAIKSILQSRLGQQNVLARFQKEGEAIGRLHHPNIVGAIDSGSNRQWFYLVMEFVPGTDLRRRLIDSGPLPVAVALSIVRQTAAGLSHALSLNIIHRDIKPGNLMLTDAPAGFELPPGVPLVKIADFGLARLSDTSDGQEDSQLTMTGTALGTPMYSAPEQLTGDPLDHRADIYALGCSLFHVITGEPPFKGDRISELITAKVTGKSIDLERLPADPPGLRPLLMEMLHHDPQQRLPNYEALIQRIDRLGEASISSIPPSRSDDETIERPVAELTEQDQEAPVEKGTRRWYWKAVAVLSLIVVSAVTAVALIPGGPTAIPTLLRTGWERPLFDGKGTTGWSTPRGSWKSGQDSEGAAILIGEKGSLARVLPTPSDGGDNQLGVEVSIDLRNATASEIQFGFASDDLKNSERYIVRYQRDHVIVGRQSGVSGKMVLISDKIDSPAPGSPDVPQYHQVRVEQHAANWFVFFDDEPVATVPLLSDVSRRMIQLVAPDDTVHFANMVAFELGDPESNVTQ